MSDKFKNISAINANITSLYKSIAAPLVPNFKTNLVIDNRYYHGNVVIYTQNIAKQIANHFGLQISKIIVTFIHNLGVPGKVGLSAGNIFFVEVDEKYKSNTNFISAILAHEIAHIYLFRHNIRISDTLRNEILTDTAAAFLGCAWLILNSSYEEASELNMTINTFGYITQYEVGYIQAKRDFLLQQDSSDAMIYGHSREFFDAGKSHFLDNLGRPYVQRSAVGNLAYRLKSRLKTGSIVFRCICCEQQLKIPESNKTLSVYCPGCGNKLLCYS
ncbi:MAG: hypothetical protein PHF56_07295 [Desulfuromonadaceae bacterium]|nr:hypothetical protein [Desulfuromonadaceae bacterium]